MKTLKISTFRLFLVIQLSLIQLLNLGPGTGTVQAQAPVKEFNISAIDVVITVNRFGDHNPLGKMFVLNENIPVVRAQEARPLPGRVSLGLRDDPIQPLVIRANVGDAVVINFTNRLAAGSASIHILGIPADAANAGSNVALNPDTTVEPGKSITYRWTIPDRANMQGSYVFNSMGDPRGQQKHGLFGVLNVEPKGSIYLNPVTGQPQKSGWEAIIVDPAGKDFREDTIIYHEFGDESFNMRDKNGGSLPLNDSIGVYRPGSRLLNYRSEPFFRRMELAKEVLGHEDESQGYGSYMFGDPPTPGPRGYRGDPTKRRIVHGGSERFHVEHLHGGSIRWRFDPFVEPDQWGLPPDKHPPSQSLSQRLDSQSIGPGEAYTIQTEGAAGGLQGGAGDFLFHCHFPHHYIGGMWSFWRVFDTLQTVATTFPGHPPLAELPDRAGQTPLAVDSRGLTGLKLPSGKVLTDGPTTPAAKNIDEWIRSLLPPQGAPGNYDATVWDWVREDSTVGPLYLSEPETVRIWPNYTSPTPGQRLRIMFNPENGYPAYPLLRPHLGKRPPFSPGRSGAPWLGEPGADHSDSLIPSDARRIEYTVVTRSMPITFNEKFNIRVEDAALLVLDEDKEDILAGRKPREQLTIRANVGDGVDVTLYSEETDKAFGGFAKANIHIHFVQFDTQASDGVISGLSYEQSVRPYQTEGSAGKGIRLTAGVPAGADIVTVDDASRLKVNAFLGIGFGVSTNAPTGFEFAQIISKSGNTLKLDRPLRKSHPAGQFAGVEFVRYQWYADAEEGTTFFHDHVFGIPGFGKALTGALIVEPQGSQWLDPRTNLPIRSGTQANIITDKRLAPGVPVQNLREFVLHGMGAITGLRGKGFSRAEPGGFNMRQEPIANRLQVNPDPSLAFSSVTHGDPATPILRAYAGDLVGIRLINSSGHDMTAFHLVGHEFRLERFDPRETTKDALSMGISERFDVGFIAGGGATLASNLQAGDYLYMLSNHEKMMDGAWGMVRVFDTLQPDLMPIRQPPPAGPGFPRNTVTGSRPPAAYDTGNLVPPGMPVRVFNVVAIQKEIQFSRDLRIQNARAYVLAEDEAAVMAGTKPLEPLVLRANIGEAVRVNFSNHLPGARASFHIAQLLKTTDSLGGAFGFNNDSTVGPGETVTQWYVIKPEREIPRSFIITDFGDLIDKPEASLYGVFVVMPAGSTVHDPKTGAPVSSGLVVDVRNTSLPRGGFRDAVLIFLESDQIMNRDVMPYRPDVEGIRGVNYKAEPFAERLKEDKNISRVMKTGGAHSEPRTTIIRAIAGDQVRLHIFHIGQQNHVFSIDGHRFPFDLSRPNDSHFASRQIGPIVSLDAILESSGGHEVSHTGDFLYADRRNPFLEAGLWGILRVSAPAQAEVLPIANLLPGLNLVSHNVKPDSESVGDFLASISGKFNQVATWDADSGKWLTFAPEAAINTLQRLDETRGFWIWMKEAAFITPRGSLPVRTQIPLKKGWNLVGWPSLRSVPVEQAMASIEGKYDSIYAYDASDQAKPWKIYSQASEETSDLTYMRPLLGYWINMNSDATLIVDYR